MLMVFSVVPNEVHHPGVDDVCKGYGFDYWWPVSVIELVSVGNWVKVALAGRNKNTETTMVDQVTFRFIAYISCDSSQEVVNWTPHFKVASNHVSDFGCRSFQGGMLGFSAGWQSTTWYQGL
jgi:hypothetical protein